MILMAILSLLTFKDMAHHKGLLSNGSYSLITSDIDTTFKAPLTNEPYSKISGDFNPIHVNPYFSDFASLPATITHGMWSSAVTHWFIETVVAKGQRVIGYVLA